MHAHIDDDIENNELKTMFKHELQNKPWKNRVKT